LPLAILFKFFPLSLKRNRYHLCLKPRALSLFYHTVDGKLWANLFTKLTGYTSRRFNHNWRMIPLAMIFNIRYINPFDFLSIF